MELIELPGGMQGHELWLVSNLVRGLGADSRSAAPLPALPRLGIILLRAERGFSGTHQFEVDNIYE